MAVAFLVFSVGLSASLPDSDTLVDDSGFVIPVLGVGAFLVASPDLADPNFSQSVILLIEHDDQGSLGLIINFESAIGLDHALPQFEQLQETARNLFVGGPVEQSRISVLYRSELVLGTSARIVDDLHVSASASLLSELLRPSQLPVPFVVYAGYAGWAPGQLGDEVDRGSWRLATADASLIFDRAVEEIWPTMIRRTSSQWVERRRAPCATRFELNRSRSAS